MYELKQDKKEELLDGRKITYLSETLGLTQTHISNLLAGRGYMTLITSMCFISIKEKISITDTRMSEFLDYYFTKK